MNDGNGFKIFKKILKKFEKQKMRLRVGFLRMICGLFAVDTPRENEYSQLRSIILDIVFIIAGQGAIGNIFACAVSLVICIVGSLKAGSKAAA